MLSPDSFPQRRSLSAFIPKALREFVMYTPGRGEAERALGSAHNSALKLTEHLLTYPQRADLQEAPVKHLSDGRTLRVTLVNTGKLDSLDGLIRAERGADRIEVSIRDETKNQYGYSVTWHISTEPHMGDYRESQRGAQIASVFASGGEPVEHAAFIHNTQVPFTPIRQRSVYTRCQEIFDTALTALATPRPALP